MSALRLRNLKRVRAIAASMARKSPTTTVREVTTGC